jgi:hypothetical protein
MADLIQIQYEVVDKGKSLKTALTGVERMEKSLAKLSKEIVSGTVTQDRQRKALIAYGRELKRLTGMTGTQAYGAVVKYKNALVNQTVAQNKAAIASQRLAKVQDYLATRQERATLAAQKQNAALHQTKNKMNGSNMAVQQLGYQFGDFAVQVQGGTSAFVAFSQQASQLVGILPMVAGPLGLTVGAAVGLSAALGILIPIGSAAARMFFEMRDSSKEATDKVKDFEDRLKSARNEVISMKEALDLLNSGYENQTIKTFADQVETAEKKLAAARAKIDEAIAKGLKTAKQQSEAYDSAFTPEMLEALASVLRANAAPGLRQAVTNAQLELAAAKELLRQEKERERNASVINQLAKARAIIQEQEADAEKEYQDRLARTRVIMGQMEAERKAAAKAEAEEDRLANIETLAKAERELFKANAAYEKNQKELDAAGDLAIIENQANRELELSRANDEYERLSDAERQKRLDELNDKIQEMAERLAIPFAAALDLIRQAKKEAEIGLDAFGGTGSFKYGGSQKFDGEAAFDANARRKAELKDINDVIAALREQTDQETKLLGLTGERRTEEETFYQLVQENAKADIKASKDKLRAIAKEIAAQKKANAAFEKLIDITDELSDAFGDYVASGLKDFKGFTDTIKSMFKKLLSDMAAMAIKNKILIPIATGMGAGMGMSTAANAMGQYATGGAQAGTIGATLATGASNFGSAALHTITGGTAGSVAAGSTMATIGAAAPYILAAIAVIGLFTKKVKLLDSGLRTTIEGFDVAIETFKLTQSSRLFGLLKGSKKLGYEAASAEVADPLIEAIGNMQQSIIDAAGTLGIGANAFDDFSYQFKLSLKGLTEEQQLEKINEEINKMGDSFASLTGHFETMNELLEAANQRMQLQNRLDQLLGNNQAILTRQREAELSAMHELNRPLAQMVYNLEDAQASVQSAFASLGASIEAEKNRLRDAFTSIVDGLNKRLDVANETMARSNSIYSMLESAVSGRSITSGIGQSLSRREGALGFIRGGDFSDERKLEEALDVVAEPSEGLFSSFVDYARDFARTSITLEEAKKVAQVQLTADEKSVLLLEEQIAQAQVDLDAQLEALDKQYQMQVDQYNALLGIDTNVKSVEEAIGTLRSAIEALASAQAAAKAAAAVGTAGAGTGAAAAGIKLTGEKYQGYDLGNIRGAADLMAAAAQNNIQTSGKTGAQIQQAISNATGLAINMDNATRGKQFAMGGYHTGGIRMVGERGPELEATGPSRIFSHNQTASMFKDPDLKEAVNELRREVSGLRSEQRQMQASNAKYVKRNYDINRKWDVDGLPATRT